MMMAGLYVSDSTDLSKVSSRERACPLAQLSHDLPVLLVPARPSTQVVLVPTVLPVALPEVPREALQACDR